MNLLDFCRILLRHYKLLIAVPLLMAVTVFMMVKDAPKEYASKTVIYTGVVSGYTIESGSGKKLDYHVANSRFDNLINLIKTKESYEEVAIRLIALHASGKLKLTKIDAPAVFPLGNDGEGNINLAAADQVEHNFEDILVEVRQAANERGSKVYELVHAMKTPFSIKGIEKHVSVKRINSSDLIEIGYKTVDPALCQETLEAITAVFLKRYKLLKQREAGDVIAYFESETERSYNNLQSAVDRMRDFGTENRIINYYEQTKFIASQKELIDQQIQQEKMALSAARSSQATLEEKIGLTRQLLVMNAGILERRRELASLSSKVALLEASDKSSEDLRIRIETLQAQLANDIEAVYRLNNSKEGIAKDELVNQWLTSLVSVSESEARLFVLEERKSEYQQSYDEFAPLGSTLNTLEREVSIAESEYLEILHSLNLARMRQQNVEMASSLEVVDAPLYPELPESSKGMLLVALAFIIGFVFCAGGILAFEILDHTIRTPLRGAEATGLKLAGAFTSLTQEADGNDSSVLKKQLARQVKCNIELQLKRRPEFLQPPYRKPQLIVIGSTTDFAEVHDVASELAAAFEDTNLKALHVVPEQDQVGDAKAEETAVVLHATEETGEVHYATRADYSTSPDLTALTNLSSEELLVYDYVVLELPLLRNHAFPLALLKTADQALVVVAADRIWTSADQLVLQAFKQALSDEPLLVVSRVREDRIEQIAGAVPKKRSAVRSFGKRMVQMDFRS